jgi:geranylgeranyl diphosphate synthase type II
VNLDAYLAERRELVDAALEQALRPTESAPPRLIEAMRYAVLSGGKRVRPILALAACEAVPAAGRLALPFGCAVELIHAYSLVHDDLPAMDDDELRRGRPTVHVVYGEALAILAGDALLTEAFRVAAEGAEAVGVDPGRALTLVATIAAAAGAGGMVGGQVADLEAEGQVADRTLVESIHRRKTAALIAAAVDAGALAGNAAGERRAALAEYGRALGLAFQIADDILDATAPTAVTGKRVGGDAEHGKATYPAVLGLDGARAAARDLLSRCLAATDVLGTPGEPLQAIARFVVERAC